MNNRRNSYRTRNKLANVSTRELVDELESRRHSSRRKQASEDLMKKVMGEVADLTKETGGWNAGNFTDVVEDVLIGYMGSPYRAKKFQEALGIPLNEEWRDDSEGLTDLRLISVREHLLDQNWEDIFDAEYGSQ